MPLKRNVRERMIPIKNYSTIAPDTTLREAALSLRTSYCELETGMCTEAGPRTVMVVDDNGKLVGILDFNSFLVTLIPEIAGGLSAKLEALGVSIAFAQADAASLDEARLGFKARVIKNADTKVRDIMLKIRGTIDAGDSLMAGLKKMFRNKITVLPVYENDKLVGVLRDTDFFLAVTDILEE
ncbi:MAG: CBS domain-containing protein [Deltaproteobacteria bacterium]|nr:CBS domain-containing protein [Deltaproteobacteria bacterium]